MTLKTKNIILIGSTTICSLIFISHIVLFALYPQVISRGTTVLFFNSIILSICSILIHVNYKKSLPSEIIFYAIFLSAFSLQSIRIVPYIIDSKTFIFTILAGRLSIFFKYVGLLSILGASLFSYTIKKQKVGTWLLASILSSFIISSLLHFNTGVVLNNMLPRVIFNNEDLVLTILIIVTTTISFIKSGFDVKNREYFYLGVSAAILTTSLQVSFFTLNIGTGIIMGLLLIAGTVLYLKSMHNITLWG